MKLYDDPAQEALVWKVRESGLGATAHVPNKAITWEGWEDSSVPPEKLGEYLRKLRALFERYGYACDLYGHFGQGCVHTRIDFDLETADGIETFRAFLHDAAHLVVSLGGSISGEHGDGQSKAELLPIMFGDRLMEAFREFKRIWDPQGKMNPGKIVEPYHADENLRLGTAYDPRRAETHFHLAQRRRGNMERTLLRCVGVGECRKKDGAHVPELQGHRRGDAFDARPRAAAVRDGEGRSDQRRLARAGGEGSARPVPVVQGLQRRVPGERGHGHVQGRVPVALLQGRLRPRAGLHDGVDWMLHGHCHHKAIATWAMKRRWHKGHDDRPARFSTQLSGK